MKKIILAVVILAGLALFLPGFILRAQGEAAYGAVYSVPEKYISGSSAAVSRNASANLDLTQRLGLITGAWDSAAEMVSAYESSLTENEAQALARQSVEELYETGVYPDSLSAGYGNWYNWRAVCRKAVDTTFHTYAAYYWVITFTKYDGSIRHEICVLEDGTVFFALETSEDLDAGMAAAAEGECETAQVTEELLEGLSFWDGELPVFTESQAFRVTDGEMEYYLLQASAEDAYLWAMLP